jgi:hypothetical protein
MAPRGTTKNIALVPKGYKDTKPIETFVPAHIDLRNGHLTDAGNWEKRPGYAQQWDVSTERSVDLLVPEGNGYAVTEDGKVFELTGTPTELTGQRLNGEYRPTWENHNDMTIICDGGSPVKIESADTALLGGSPPNARFIGRVGPYTLLCGHDDTEVKFSASGNPETWSGGDSGFFNVKKTGEKIRNFQAHKEKAYFFKDHNAEVWFNQGGSTPFIRYSGAWINKGIGADYSLVQANNFLYWFGDDGDFYVLNGFQPQVISKSYRAEIDKIVSPSTIYGFDCRKEGLIRWFAPIDGKCFVYDYVHEVFSEDNTWAHGQFERLLWNSYMELNNEQYFGGYDPTGLIHLWSEDYKDDNGNPIRVFRQFAVPLSEIRKAKVNRLLFRGQRGVATSSVTDPKLLVEWRLNKDDWQYEELDLGAIGSYDPWEMEIRNLGKGNEIEFKIYETDAVSFLLTHMFLTYT